MKTTTTIKPITAAVGAALLVGVAAMPVANAADNPFAAQELSSGYELASNHKAMEEGKCGEGKCGGSSKADGEGKCGEGKCGGSSKAEGEGKCGEGKCGGSSKAEGEGKCGEGKCGGSSMKVES
ncbi:MAG: hypothetical protein OIF55_11170 [Amphritea sp.]|nr:hypothetical protein [Amphritea sp.]